MFEAIARFSVKFRWLIIVVWLLAIPITAKTLPSLTSVTKSNNSAFLPSSSPSQKASGLTTPFQGKNTSTTSIIVASSSSGPLTTADMGAITQVEAKIKQLQNVSLVKDQATSKDGQVPRVPVLARVVCSLLVMSVVLFLKYKVLLILAFILQERLPKMLTQIILTTLPGIILRSS